MNRHHAKVGLLAIALLFCPYHAMAQQEYVENGQFDSDIDGWVLETEHPGGALSWAGSLGNPSPGALRIQADAVEVGDYRAVTGCFPAVPQSSWVLTAQARREIGTNLTCTISMFFYDNDDCSGFEVLRTTDAGMPTGGNWEELTSVWTVDDPQTLWVKAVLALTTAPGTKACNFDDVSLIGPVTSTIPALDRAGLGALAVILLACGVVLLRRFGG